MRTPENKPEGKASGGKRVERAERKEIDIRIDCRKRGYSKAKVNLVDLSRTGFLIEAGSHFAPGETVFLHLPGFEPTPATVVRHDQFGTGCRFDTPLPDYVFENLVSRLETD